MGERSTLVLTDASGVALQHEGTWYQLFHAGTETVRSVETRAWWIALERELAGRPFLDIEDEHLTVGRMRAPAPGPDEARRRANPSGRGLGLGGGLYASYDHQV